MLTNKMQIMLYVDDVKEMAAFWDALDFVILSQEALDGTTVIEIAPSPNADVSFVLYDKNFIEEHSPEVALNSPSLMLFSDDIEILYQKVASLGVEHGELIQLEGRKIFNFADIDGNYYAVSEK